MFPLVVTDLTPKEVLQCIRKVFTGEEPCQDVPVVFPESGTCYAFSAKNNPSKKNDWRADGYRWRNNGRTNLQADGKVITRTYFGVFTAPKKCCTEFRRVANECEDYPDILIIYYSGDHTIAGRFPHGNRRSGAMPYLRTCPSVIEACRNADGEPATILRNLSNEQCESLAESLISSPRDTNQIKNLKKYTRRKLKQALVILDEVKGLTEDKFVFEINPVPELMATAYQEKRLQKINGVLGYLHISDAQYLSFRNVLHLQSFTISSVAYKCSEDFPVIFLFYIIHSSCTEVPHTDLWKMACLRLPKLSLITNMPLRIGDNGFDLDEAEDPPVEIFTAVLNKMQRWKESPALAVWELQENASKLQDLAKYYEKCSKAKTRKKTNNETKHTTEKHTKVPTTPDSTEIQLLTDNEDIRWFKASDESSLTSLSSSPAHNDNGDPPSCNDHSRMKKLFKVIHIKYIPESGSFLLVREHDVRMVKLFPKETCTCKSSTDCIHIVACKYFIGQEPPPIAAEEDVNDHDRVWTRSATRNKRKKQSESDEKLVVEIMTQPKKVATSLVEVYVSDHKDQTKRKGSARYSRKYSRRSKVSKSISKS